MLPKQSGAKATAVQALRNYRTTPTKAKRLDCGGSPPLFTRLKRRTRALTQNIF
jgi:hypothetical protein